MCKKRQHLVVDSQGRVSVGGCDTELKGRGAEATSQSEVMEPRV